MGQIIFVSQIKKNKIRKNLERRRLAKGTRLGRKLRIIFFGFVLGILVLSFQNCAPSSMATLPSIEETNLILEIAPLKPLGRISYSAMGDLSSSACFLENVETGREPQLVLHLEPNPNPHEQYSTKIDGVAVSACVAFDFEASNPAEILIAYRSVSEALPSCSDGCRGEFCETGGEPEIFVSSENSLQSVDQWKSLRKFGVTRPSRHKDLTETRIALPKEVGTVRSVLVCRDGGSLNRDDLLISQLELKLGAAGFDQKISPPLKEASPYRRKMTAFWSEVQERMNQQPNQVWNSFDSTPSIYPLLAGWLVDRNPIWRTSIERQAQFSHDQRLYEGLPYLESSKNPNLITRQIVGEALALYHVYETFNEKKYLGWVDDIAENMIARLARGVSTRDRQDFKLFYESYEKKFPHKPISKAKSKNPRQNAETGLLFTYLYHNKDSKFYHQLSARKIAREELDGSIALQKRGGEIPIHTEEDEIDDTDQGSRLLAALAVANSYWKNEVYDTALFLGGKWLERWMQPGRYAFHMGEDVGKTKESGSEMWWRIPAYDKAGTDLKSYKKDLYLKWLDPDDTNSNGALVFFRSAGIPLKVYFPSDKD